MATHLCRSLEMFAETLRQSDGTAVGRIDQTDRSLPLKMPECMGQRSARRFKSKPFAPLRAGERPGNLFVGPTVRKVEAHAPDEGGTCSLLDRPHPEAAQVPVADEHRHLPPGVVTAEDSSLPNVAHDLRVGAHGGVGLDVGLSKRAEQEALGVKREHGAGSGLGSSDAA